MIEHLYYGVWEDVEIEDAEGRAREQRSRGAVVDNVEDRWIRAIDLQRERRRPPTKEQATQIYNAVRRGVAISLTSTPSTSPPRSPALDALEAFVRRRRRVCAS